MQIPDTNYITKVNMLRCLLQRVRESQGRTLRSVTMMKMNADEYKYEDEVEGDA